MYAARTFSPFSPTLGAWLCLFFQAEKYARITEFGCGLGWYLRMLRDDGFTNVVGIDEGAPLERELTLRGAHLSVQRLRERSFDTIITRRLGYPLVSHVRGHAIALDTNKLVAPDREPTLLENLRGGVELGKALVVSWDDRARRDVPLLFRGYGFDVLEEPTRSARSVITDGDCPWFRTTLHVMRKVR